MIKKSFSIIRREWRPFVILNVVFYGIVIVMLLYARADPRIQNQHFLGLRAVGTSSFYAPVFDAYYGNPNFLLAITLTFAYNFILGSLVSITLPSLVVPFWGLLAAWFRAYLWGGLFSPSFMISSPSVYVLLVLEGQGYVLASFAAYEQGIRLLKPHAFGLASRLAALREGFNLTRQIYILVAIVLAFAACFEVSLSRMVYHFPQITTPLRLSKASDDSVTVPYSQATIYHDSHSIRKEYALACGALLEDIRFLRSGSRPAVRLSTRDTVVAVQVQLDESNWPNPTVKKKFFYCIQQLNKAYPARAFVISAVDTNARGELKETDLKF
jgi:hypothetical protein